MGTGNKVSRSIQAAQLKEIEGMAVFSPMVTMQAYANMVGISVDTVRGHVRLGHLPTVKQGKYRFINMVAVLQTCTAAAKDDARSKLAR